MLQKRIRNVCGNVGRQTGAGGFWPPPNRRTAVDREPPMSESQLISTPGPWTAVKASGQRGGIGVFEVKAVEDLSDFAHRSIVSEKAGLDEADATLIAAAPDLLEALKRLLADCVDPNVTPEMAFKSGAI